PPRRRAMRGRRGRAAVAGCRARASARWPAPRRRSARRAEAGAFADEWRRAPPASARRARRAPRDRRHRALFDFTHPGRPRAARLLLAFKQRMTDSTAAVASLSGRTAWARNLEEPLRSFLRTETGGAAILLAAALTALIWANADPSSYRSVWHTVLTIRIGGAQISQSLQRWVND